METATKGNLTGDSDSAEGHLVTSSGNAAHYNLQRKNLMTD